MKRLIYLALIAGNCLAMPLFDISANQTLMHCYWEGVSLLTLWGAEKTNMWPRSVR